MASYAAMFFVRDLIRDLVNNPSDPLELHVENLEGFEIQRVLC
jgi:hypothetical protein